MSARSQISHPQSVILVGRIPSAARKALVQVSLGNPLLSADIMNAPGLAVQNYSPGATLFSALLLYLSTRGIQIVVYLQMPALQSGVLLVSMSCYKGFFLFSYFFIYCGAKLPIPQYERCFIMICRKLTRSYTGKYNAVLNLRKYFSIYSVIWTKSGQRDWCSKETREANIFNIPGCTRRP